MFGLDAFHLARIQFAFTVSFHIIFSGDHHRSGELSRRPGRAMAENKKSGLAFAVPFLVEDIRR